MALKTLPPSNALIPDDAVMVFEGQIYDVYQWPQQMFDGTVKTFEMLKRPDTLQVIVVKGKQILLVNDEQPGRSPRRHFPGGRLDAGEEWLEGAQRELREEAGLQCADWRLLDVQQPIIKIEWFTPIFLATNITSEGPQQLDEGGERITLEWSDFDDVREQVLSGREQMMQYLVPFFNRVRSLDELLSLPEFIGETCER